VLISAQVWASDAFLDMTGYGRGDVVGRNCRFLQGPRTEARSVAEIRDAVRREHETSVTLLNYRADGAVFWNRFFVAPLRGDDGAVAYFVGVQTDVTAAFARAAALPGLDAAETPKPSPAAMQRSLA